MKKLLCLIFTMLICSILVSCNSTNPDDKSSIINNSELVNNTTNENNKNTDLSNVDVLENSEINKNTDLSSVDVLENSTINKNTDVLEKVESTTSCQQCNCCKNSSDVAILIAQTHFFETFDDEIGLNMYYLFKIINEPNILVENIEDEYWYIMPVLYQNGEPADFIGGRLYVYMIKKSTGEISDLLIFAGE